MDDLNTVDPASLLAAARIAGVRYFLLPYYPAELIICGASNPEADRIVAAMRDRRDEIAAYLAALRPAPLDIPDDERRFRRDVLQEPDVPLGELPWPVFAAMVISLVRDTLDEERAAVGDGVRDTTAPDAARPPASTAKRTAVEYRGGKVVRR